MSNEEMGIQKDLIRRYGNTVGSLGCHTYIWEYRISYKEMGILWDDIRRYVNTVGYLTMKWEYCRMSYEGIWNTVGYLTMKWEYCRMSYEGIWNTV